VTWLPSGAPVADSALHPFITVGTCTNGVAQVFSLSIEVHDPSGALVGTVTGTGSVQAGNGTTWSPNVPLPLPNASLWHLVDAPLSPALYTLCTTLAVDGGCGVLLSLPPCAARKGKGKGKGA
jgi:hypothetical protein